MADGQCQAAKLDVGRRCPDATSQDIKQGDAKSQSKFTGDRMQMEQERGKKSPVLCGIYCHAFWTKLLR